MESEAMWDGDDKGEHYQEEWHRLHQTFSDSHRSIFMHMGCAWTFTGTRSSKLAFIGLHIGLTDIRQPVRLLLNSLPWKAAHLFTCSTIVWMLPQTGLQRLRALRVDDILTLPLDLTWALFARPSLRSDSCSKDGITNPRDCWEVLMLSPSHTPVILKGSYLLPLAGEAAVW